MGFSRVLIQRKPYFPAFLCQSRASRPQKTDRAQYPVGFTQLHIYPTQPQTVDRERELPAHGLVVKHKALGFADHQV